MPPPRYTREQIIESALDVFRSYGFEGASLSRLAATIGIEKATLYHHFPEGKEQLAGAVADYVAKWFAQHIFAPLQDHTLPPPRRLRAVLGELSSLYGDGSKPCVLDALSLAGGSAALAEPLKTALQAWLKSFAQLAREHGASPAAAHRRAEQAIVRLEGALIVSRVLGDTEPFRRSLATLPQILLPAGDSKE